MSDPSRLVDTSKRNCICLVTKNSQNSLRHTLEIVKNGALHADHAA